MIKPKHCLSVLKTTNFNLHLTPSDFKSKLEIFSMQGSYRSPEKKFHSFSSFSIAFQFLSIGMKLIASVLY